MMLKRLLLLHRLYLLLDMGELILMILSLSFLMFSYF